MTILAGQRIRAIDFVGSAFDFETAVDTTTSTSYVDGTVHGVAFTAPSSGSVWIRWGGQLGSSSTTAGLRSLLSFYVRTGSTVDAGTDVLVADDERSCEFHKANTTAAFYYDQVSQTYLLTGLTAGSSYNVITQYRSVGDTAAVDNRWIAVEPYLA